VRITALPTSYHRHHADRVIAEVARLTQLRHLFGLTTNTLRHLHSSSRETISFKLPKPSPNHQHGLLMILGFAGIGFMPCRSKNKLALKAA
jgi:hypothetical protein